MQRKLAEHRVLLLSDPWQIRYVYIMAFDDTFRRAEIPAWWETRFPRDGRGGGVCPSCREPQAWGRLSLTWEMKSILFNIQSLGSLSLLTLAWPLKGTEWWVWCFLSLGQKANSVIAPCPGEQQLFRAKEKEKHFLNTTACTGAGQGGSIWENAGGAAVVFSTKFHSLRLV